MHTDYKTTTEKLLRYSLGSLLLFVALNAFGGGFYGMSGAEAIPLAWLDGTVFNSYFIPGLILFVCVGGSAFLAGIAVLRKHRMAGKASFFSGLVIVGWIVVQLAIIGYVSWLQPFILLLAIIIVILALLLLKHAH